MSNVEEVKVLLKTRDERFIPKYQSPGSAGADLHACLDQAQTLPAGSSTLVPTGLFMEIPPGFELQVRPRSGLALKHQITVLNTPGTIDSDYRGEIAVILINHGKADFTIEPGMRIAQGVLARCAQAVFVIDDQLSETKRGAGGFGHSGFH
ncbi:MAG: dut [Chlamydiales bacterium]|jgi:dUTP pyrophosphatase|nr:dut [Chlamydiales bacterium]